MSTYFYKFQVWYPRKRLGYYLATIVRTSTCPLLHHQNTSALERWGPLRFPKGELYSLMATSNRSRVAPFSDILIVTDLQRSKVPSSLYFVHIYALFRRLPILTCLKPWLSASLIPPCVPSFQGKQLGFRTIDVQENRVRRESTLRP